MNPAAQRFRTGWSVLAWIFVTLSVIPLDWGHVSLFQHALWTVFTDAFIVLAPAGGLLALARGARRGLLPLGLLTLWGLAVWFVPPHPPSSQGTALAGWLVVVALWVLGRHGQWLKAVVWATLPLLVLALIAVLIIPSFPAAGIPLALDAAVLFPFAALFGMNMRPRWISVLALMSAALILGVLMASASATALLAALTALVVMVVAIPQGCRRRLPWIFLVAAVMVPGFGAVMATRGTLTRIPGLLTQSLPLSIQRLNPVSASGWLSLLCFLAFVAALIAVAVRLRRQADPWGLYLGTAGLAALIGELVAWLVTGGSHPGLPIWWVACGLLLGGLGLTEPANPARSDDSPYRFHGRLW